MYIMANLKSKKKASNAKKDPVTKKVVAKALKVRKKLSLQKRAGDTIVYVRMKPPMFDVFEEAYATHCKDNMLNPQSYGMSTFVRENAFANLKKIKAI